MCKSKPNISKSATFRALFLVLVIGWVSGCAVKFVYNQLDWAIPWYLSDYMSLDGDQEDAFDESLERYLSWHRTTQLPVYGDFLNKVADELDKGISEASIAFIQDRTQQLGRVLVERLAPDVVVLFQGASDSQIAELFEKFEEDNESYREDYIDVSERAQRKQRAKEVQAYIERWTGRLTKPQKAIIREGTNQYQLMGEEFLAAKLAWQAEFMRILQLRDQPNEYKTALTTLLLSEGFGQTEAFSKKLEHNKAVLVSLYLQLDKSLSIDQREKAVRNLRSYAQDFFELAN